MRGLQWVGTVVEEVTEVIVEIRREIQMAVFVANQRYPGTLTGYLLSVSEETSCLLR